VEAAEVAATRLRLPYCCTGSWLAAELRDRLSAERRRARVARRAEREFRTRSGNGAATHADNSSGAAIAGANTNTANTTNSHPSTQETSS
jgi:hypothetical protein